MRQTINTVLIAMLILLISCGEMTQVQKGLSISHDEPQPDLDQLGFELVHPSEFIPQDLHCEEPSEYIPEDLYCAGY